MHVFNLDGSKLGSAEAWYFHGMQASQTPILVNVSGSSVTLAPNYFGADSGRFDSLADAEFGNWASRIMFNFYEAESLEIQGASQFMGSILAPHARADFTPSTNGRVYVGGDLTVRGVGQEQHNYPWTGADDTHCDSTPPAPEELPAPEEPEGSEDPVDPEDPLDPEDPVDPEDPEDGEDPEGPEDGDEPEGPGEEEEGAPEDPEDGDEPEGSEDPVDPEVPEDGEEEQDTPEKPAELGEFEGNLEDSAEEDEGSGRGEEDEDSERVQAPTPPGGKSAAPDLQGEGSELARTGAHGVGMLILSGLGAIGLGLLFVRRRTKA